MSNIATLRQHLFDTIDGLRNKTIDIEHARAINDTAQTIINSAKVEVDYMRVSGSVPESSFMTAIEEQKQASSQRLTAIDEVAGIRRTANGVAHSERILGATVTTHKMR